jgi:hypothetical protein
MDSSFVKLLLVVIAASFIADSCAEECAWTCQNTDFAASACWSCGHVPSVNDSAVIAQGHVTVSKPTSICSLIVSSAAIEIGAQSSLTSSLCRGVEVFLSIQDGSELIMNGERSPLDAKGGIVHIDGKSNVTFIAGYVQNMTLINEGSINVQLHKPGLPLLPDR